MSISIIMLKYHPRIEMPFNYPAILTWIILWSISIVGTKGQDCDSYDTLPNLNDRDPSASYTYSNPAICDKSLTTGWYRAGSYDMPTSPVPDNRCGTAYGLYMDIAVPIDSSVRDARACLSDGIDHCYYYVNIKVKNCGGYRIYHLQSTGFCNSAYCFHLANSSSEETSTLSFTSSVSSTSTHTTSTSQKTEISTTTVPPDINRTEKQSFVDTDLIKTVVICGTVVVLAVIAAVVVIMLCRRRSTNMPGQARSETTLTNASQSVDHYDTSSDIKMTAVKDVYESIQGHPELPAYEELYRPENRT